MIPLLETAATRRYEIPTKRIRSEELADALAGLTASGADVHVRVESKTDGADERIKQLERTCPGWFIDDDRAPRLLTLIVLPDDHQTGIYYGREWYTLGSQWENIQADKMNPRFKEGDFTGGIADGLSAINRVFRGSYSPPYSLPPSNSKPLRHKKGRGGPDATLVVFLIFVGSSASAT